MKKIMMPVVLSAIFLLGACAGGAETKETAVTVSVDAQTEPESQTLIEVPHMVDMPVKWSDERERLMREYTGMHYGKELVTIEPQVVVVHWTVTEGWEEVYNYFYNETMPDDGGGRLNVTSHFLVARDGTIYKLTEETAMNRHAIGYNWCAIGIENVGGVGGKENLTEAQLQANIALIRYLSQKYSTIRYVWGHYQQDQAKESGLFIENVPDYYAGKIDPGPIFMRGLREGLADTGLKFYTE